MSLHNIKDCEPNHELIEKLRILLQDAESGKLRSFFCVCGWDDDGWTHGWQKDPRNSGMRALGMLSMLQYDAQTAHASTDSKYFLRKGLNGDLG